MKRINKYIAMLSAAIVTACALPVSVFAAKISTSVLQMTTTLESYGAYLEANKLGNSKAGLSFEAQLANGGGGITLSEGEAAVFTVSLPETAFYTIELTYQPADDCVTDIEACLKLNGKVPFDEIGSFSLIRLWEDDKTELSDGKYPTDSDGNEISPSLVTVDSPVTQRLCDYSGSSVHPFKFAMNSGENEIVLTSVRNSLKLISVKVKGSEESALSYEEYLKKYDVSDYGGETIVIEGESAAFKSSSQLVAQSDKSSPATSPSSASKTLVNTIGGSSWSEPGQWIEWKVNCAEDGYYTFGIKYRQNVISGMFTTRALYLNGEIPFKEAQAMEFAYSSKWQACLFSDSGGEPYKIYLKKGENTIRLEVSLGRSVGFYALGMESVDRLNSAYRQIIMLTGTAPDQLRNYRVDKNCPEAMEIIKEQISVLNEFSNGISEIAGKKGSINTAADNLRLQLESFVSDPITIPSRIDSFRTNITSYADSVYKLANQPLEIDYITLSSPEKEEVNEIDNISVSLFTRLGFEIKAFIASFAEDYSDSSGENSITVWVSTGRDQATVLKRLADIKFTKETGISVNIKMVAAGTGVSTLLLATVSGQGPDAAVGVANSEAVNYALRDTALELSEMDGFNKACDRFMPSAMAPFEYDGGYYALPMTQGFFVMFSRGDILEEAGIKVPQTWNELYSVMGELQKKNMTVGIPADINYLITQIFQNGGKIYSEDKTTSLFDSTASMSAFSKWCNLYTSYNLPMDYDGANRFRTGEMPLIIADYSFYNTVSVLAPEIKGLWGFTELPGTKQTDGSISRVSAATGTCSMILSTTKKPVETWKFLNWLTSDDIQSEYARSLESRLGIAARFQTANIKALSDISWIKQEYETLMAQWKNTVGVEEVPGSYYVARNINNALRNVVSYDNDPQEVLKEYTLTINEEIRKKRDQYKLD